MERILAMRRSDDSGVVLLSEVARALGLKRSTAYIAARAGELPMKLIGGRYEMRRADFERLLADHRQRPAVTKEPRPAALETANATAATVAPKSR